jgi:predicted alpha-1,2-mannosidase
MASPYLRSSISASQNNKTRSITYSNRQQREFFMMAKSPAQWVNPLIDTANRRFFFFSSASRPFGMVNLSPDTAAGGGAWEAGYRYNKNTICWFSHIHGWQLSGIPILPTIGPMRGHEGVDVYKSTFNHDNETVQPGYHQVYLDSYNINAELTATDRVGFHRYTCPKAEDVHILFDLTTTIGPSDISDASIEKTSDTELVGYVVNAPTRRRPKALKIYFVAQFDRPIKNFGGWQDGEVIKSAEKITGPNTGAFVHFTTDEGDTIHLKVAISYCDIDGARNNLNTELPHWHFDQIRQEATDAWNGSLGRIEVEGGTDAQKTKFYTDLYHALLGRRRVSDKDGRYIDNTGNTPTIRKIPLNEKGIPLYEHHNSDAFWGAQWTLNVLWPLAWPEITHNFCNTFLDMYKNGGLIPRGPSGGNYTFVMTSATSTPFFVSAYQKGIRSFDIEKAYEGLRKNHFPGGLMSKAGYEHDTFIGGGVEYYIARGYIPMGIKAHAFHCDGPAQTLECAFQDWTLAQLAQALGKTEDAELFLKRAHNYQNLYNPNTHFMHPRTMDGEWLKDFDPHKSDGWNEGNGWHYLWWAPHDPMGLAKLMGGTDTFIKRLNEQFEIAAEKNFIAPHAKHHENVIEYGNQPCTHFAHLFNYVGAPWLSQKWTREVMKAAKSDITPQGGYGGDEDQGMMGSLNSLMALGLFAMRGGCEADPIYDITSPIFDRITIHMSPDETFIIETQNNTPENIYIQSATLNGKTHDRAWFRHSDLINDGKLTLTLGPEPNTEWGVKKLPPSMTPSDQA